MIDPMLDNLSDQVYQELLEKLDLKYHFCYDPFKVVYFRNIVEITKNTLSISQNISHFSIHYYDQESVYNRTPYNFRYIEKPIENFTETVLDVIKNYFDIDYKNINCFHYHHRNNFGYLCTYLVFKSEQDRFYCKLLT